MLQFLGKLARMFILYATSHSWYRGIRMLSGSRSILMFMVFQCLICFCAFAFGDGDANVQEACSVTQYRDICIRSLSSFSSVAKTNPSIWARAGVSVTLREVRNVTQYLTLLRRSNIMRGRSRGALLDCIELFQDALDNLHRSLGVLRQLDAPTFEEQMADVTTWMSTVLTDEDTCLDGFQVGRRGYRQARTLMNKVMNCTYCTSNALALINKLASTGLRKQS